MDQLAAQRLHFSHQGFTFKIGRGTDALPLGMLLD